jgi:hypothetical protein
MRSASLPIVLGLAPLLAGCQQGKEDAVPVYPVSGRVLYDGKPAAGVKVFLLPTSAPTRPQVPAHPHGTTGADGRFTLTTYAEGDGAAAGGYQVALIWPPETKEDEEPPDTDRLMGWFDPAHTTLSAHIKSGSNELPTISIPLLKGPPEALQGIPGRN